ncbi:phage antirepressor KilAC domain-containing protein [Comamonas antarctica]|uniref:Phage antirepressor KilAC domain-containing protein n=2 Tax=Comamonas antarctica TaxID=2743470 RepID=A0A6N1X6G7_9BURK|nr:phage antirepressor KilAC domain-containing protein [Comamonas antarctica]
MSSREIAELTCKRHADVMRDIRVMMDALSQNADLRSVCISSTYAGENDQRYPQYELDKDTSLTLLLGYDVVARMKVVKRWQELEAQQAPAPAIPQTWAQALRLAAEQAEQLEQQQAALALAAPKVEFVDRYVEADTGSMGFRQVCKLLGANEARFRDFLTSAKVMYLLGGVWTPHAQHMNTGRFVVKTGHSKQNDHAFTQAKFTSKGVEWVSSLWRQECQRLEKTGVK